MSGVAKIRVDPVVGIAEAGRWRGRRLGPAAPSRLSNASGSFATFELSPNIQDLDQENNPPVSSQLDTSAFFPRLPSGYVASIGSKSRPPM